MPDTAKTVGRYEILGEIGSGGMALVHLARQADIDRLVALKELDRLHASDPAFAQRFLRESQLAGGLAHPNIVTVFDYFEWEGTPYIAMEYLERGSLRRFLGLMTLAQAGSVLQGVLGGIAHAERRGIVHRDLKPENVLVTLEGQVKIADFGIAKATTQVATEAFKTDTGTTLGTPGYMAPEQAMARELGPWTDLYSVGCMAYEMVVGRLPFHDSETPMAMLLRHINEPIPAASSVDPDADPETSDWIAWLLQKAPSDRPQSARDAWDRLEEILIARMGPRWRRDAELPDVPPVPTDRSQAGSELPQAVSGPYTPPPAQPAAPSSKFLTFGPQRIDASGELKAPRAPPVRETDPGYDTYQPPPPLRPPTDDSVERGTAAEPAAASDEDVAPTDPPTATGASVSESESAPAASDSKQDSGPEPGSTVAPQVVPSPPTARPAAPPGGSSRDIAPPGAPVAPQARRRRVGWAVAGCAAVALVIGAVAVWRSGGDESAPPPPPPVGSAQLKAGRLELTAPRGLERLDTSPALPALPLEPAAAAGADRSAAGAVVVGVADAAANTPALLPDAFIDSLGLEPGEQPRRETVALGPSGWKAFYYPGLRPAGLARELGLYAWPTSLGVVIVGCLAPLSPERCRSAAASLRADDVQGFLPGPDGQYSLALERQLERLTRSLRESRRELRTAETQRGQAVAAATIAAAFGRAGSGLRRLRLGPVERAAHAALVRAMLTTPPIYRRLAASARGGNRAAYRRVARRAERAEVRVERALDDVLANAYRRLVRSRFHAATVPALRPASSPRPTPTPARTPGPTPEPTPTPIPPSPGPDPDPDPPLPTPVPPPASDE